MTPKRLLCIAADDRAPIGHKFVRYRTYTATSEGGDILRVIADDEVGYFIKYNEDEGCYVDIVYPWCVKFVEIDDAY